VISDDGISDDFLMSIADSPPFYGFDSQCSGMIQAILIFDFRLQNFTSGELVADFLVGYG